MLSHWLFERSASVSSRRRSWTLWVGSTSLGLRLYLCRQDLQWQVTAWHFALLYAGSWLDFGILSVVVFTVITINIIILLHLYTHHMPKNLFVNTFTVLCVCQEFFAFRIMICKLYNCIPLPYIMLLILQSQSIIALSFKRLLLSVQPVWSAQSALICLINLCSLLISQLFLGLYKLNATSDIIPWNILVYCNVQYFTWYCEPFLTYMINGKNVSYFPCNISRCSYSCLSSMTAYQEVKWVSSVNIGA